MPAKIYSYTMYMCVNLLIRSVAPRSFDYNFSRHNHSRFSTDSDSPLRLSGGVWASCANLLHSTSISMNLILINYAYTTNGHVFRRGAQRGLTLISESCFVGNMSEQSLSQKPNFLVRLMSA